MDSSNTDAVLRTWNDEYRWKMIPNTVLLSIGLVFGFFGNGIVILIYSLKMKNGKDDRYFIPFLAFLDMLASTFGIIDCMLNNFFWITYPSDLLCKGIVFLSASTSGASAHILLSISLYRFLRICRPHGKQMTLFWRRLALGLISILSIAYALPVFAVAGIADVDDKFGNRNVTGYCCAFAGGEYSVYKLIYFFVLLFFIIANIVATSCLYIPIGWVIYKRFKNRTQNDNDISSIQGSKYENTNPTDTRGTESSLTLCEVNSKVVKGVFQESPTRQQKPAHNCKKARANFNQMFMAVVIIYVLSYIPTFAFIIIAGLDEQFWFSLNTTLLNVYWSLSRMFIVNHIVNPFIYGYFDIQFRQKITRVLRKCQ